MHTNSLISSIQSLTSFREHTSAGVCIYRRGRFTSAAGTPCPLICMAVRVKDVFGLPFALVYGDELMDQKVSRISVCPGAGGSEIEGALAWGAQVLVTGDISHHQGIDAAARGMAIIDGGHYGLEHIFIPYMAEFLRKNLGSQVELEQAPPQWPAMIV